MEKNRLKHTGLLMLIVMVALLLMYLLPGMTVGEHVMRRVDILSDIRPTPPPAIEKPDPPVPK